MFPRRMAAAAGLALLVQAPALHGQSTHTVVASPTVQSWQFNDAVPLDAMTVKSATQISLPFLIERGLGTRWRASASGAVFSSSITTDSARSGTTRSLSGLTDVRLRATGRLIGDALQLTVGVNVPTGATGLSVIENTVLRVIAAPALGAQVAVPGTGLGGTVGLLSAHTVGPWALALGASVEKRGTYSPVEATIAGRSASTELAPGGTAHLSLGADRLLGANRLTVGVVGDLYGTDEIHAIANGASKTDTYQLGPTGLIAITLQIASTRIRDLTLQFSDRYRSSFKDGAGVVVEGSSGNYIELGGMGTLGTPGRPSLVLGLDVRQQSGLPVDKSFIGAGLTAAGATVGASFPQGGVEWRPSVRLSMGTLKTEQLSTAVRSITAGLTISAR